MTSSIELLVVLLSSFGLNLIPFAGPSNLFIASSSALILDVADPATLTVLGLLVAFGAAIAKSIHYLLTFFVGKHLREKQRQRLDAEALKAKAWAPILIFVAAATPIPDEPVIIPLGLMKYSPLKFLLVFFCGKLTITVAGAFLGSWTRSTFLEWLSSEAMIIISIVLTVAATFILLKIDAGKPTRFSKRKALPAREFETDHSKTFLPNEGKCCSMPTKIPLEKAIRLCREYRDTHKARLFSQCWGCLRFSKEEPSKMCFNDPPENRGCKFINELFDKTG